MKLKTLPIFLAFLVMGVADAMGPMSKAAKEAYNISTVMAKLLPFFVFIAFAALSVPGGLLAARIGKKKLLLTGLALNTVAVAVPTFIVPNFQLLLACIFLLGVGTTFLQVAGNPIMRDVSAAGAYSRNLAFAQGIKGIGSFGSTALLALVAAIPFLAERQWRGAFPVYLLLMVLTFISVAGLKIEEAKADVPPSIGSSLGLLKEPVFALAVLGIFLYVGAEVCMTSSLESQMNAVGIVDKWGNYLGPTAFLIALTIGRLVAGSVNVSPRAFFRLSAVLGLAGVLLILTSNQMLTVAGAILGGLGFANIWPMLFSITVEEKPERGSELSGLMCMAISGGAIVPLLMGRLVDNGMKAMSFVVPAACFAYLLLLSLKGGRKPAAPASTPAPAA